jgi:hypothetical protein
MPNDEDWPTVDPYLPSNSTGQARFSAQILPALILARLLWSPCFLFRQHTMKELLDTHWKDKTVSPQCAPLQDYPTQVHLAGHVHRRLDQLARVSRSGKVTESALHCTRVLTRCGQACEAAKAYNVVSGGHGLKSKDTDARSLHKR